MKLKQEDYFFPFDWNEKEIWKIDSPVTEIALSELDWLLDIDWFGTDENPLTPNEVLTNPKLDLEHYGRIEKADMSYPIDLGLNERVNKLVPFDGLHRICKAKLQGQKTIKCRIVPVEKVKKDGYVDPVKWVDYFTSYWQEKQVDKIIELFDGDCEYWETPWERVVGIDNIRKKWQPIAKMKDMKVTCNLIAGRNEHVFAGFNLTFGTTEQSIINELKIANGKCIYLKQWFMTKS